MLKSIKIHLKIKHFNNSKNNKIIFRIIQHLPFKTIKNWITLI